MFFVSFCCCLCSIHWSQVLSREWRCIGAFPAGDAPTTSEWSTIYCQINCDLYYMFDGSLHWLLLVICLLFAESSSFAKCRFSGLSFPSQNSYIVKSRCKYIYFMYKITNAPQYLQNGDVTSSWHLKSPFHKAGICEWVPGAIVGYPCVGTLVQRTCPCHDVIVYWSEYKYNIFRII